MIQHFSLFDSDLKSLLAAESPDKAR